MSSLVVFGNHKGGCGKTTLCVHLAWCASEAGIETLVLDLDDQTDATFRLTGHDVPPLEEAIKWADNGTVIAAPNWSGAIDMNRKPFDAYELVLVDTKPKQGLPQDVVPDGVVVPIDGVEALKNGVGFVSEVAAAKVPCILVLNGVNEGGSSFSRELGDIKNLPPLVTVCPVVLLRGGSIKRSSGQCSPAWNDTWKGAAGDRIYEWAVHMIGVAGDWVPPKGGSAK